MGMVIGELGSGGWVKDPQKQIARLFSYALTSDHSQSNIYKGEVTSIPFLIAQNQNEPERMKSALENALDKLYSRYFSNVTTIVDITESTTTNEYALNLSIECVHDNKTYTLAAAGQLKDSILTSVVSEINK